MIDKNVGSWIAREAVSTVKVNLKHLLISQHPMFRVKFYKFFKYCLEVFQIRHLTRFHQSHNYDVLPCYHMNYVISPTLLHTFLVCTTYSKSHIRQSWCHYD